MAAHSDVVVPEGVDTRGGRTFSMEVKLFELTYSSVGVTHLYRWYLGGTVGVPARELKAIRRELPQDNTDFLGVAAFDPLTGDVYLWTTQLKSTTTNYFFNNSTFRNTSTRYGNEVLGENDEEPPPGRHRPVDQLQLWYNYMCRWFGGPPKQVFHLHPAGEQDDHYAPHRPEVHANVQVVTGLAHGESSPPLGAEAHAFVRTRAARYSRPVLGDDFIGALDGTDPVVRVKAVRELFAGGDNIKWGQ